MDTPSLDSIVGNTGEHTPVEYPRPEVVRGIEEDVSFGAAHDGLKKSSLYDTDADSNGM